MNQQPTRGGPAGSAYALMLAKLAEDKRVLIHLADFGTALVLCVLSLTARGNVAAILRTNHDEHRPRIAAWRGQS